MKSPSVSDPCFRKGIDWRHEQEWRIVRFLREAIDKKDCEPHPIYFFELPQTVVREQIIGFKMTQERKVEIQKLLATGQHRDITVFVAEKIRQKLTIDIKRITAAVRPEK